MGVDPVAAAAAGSADLTALIDAELAQLAADGAALRATLVEDAVVTARVLPSNGLSDLLEIAGRRVAASLPPSVRPGDVLQVRVTGFDGERILVQIVGTGPAGSASPSSIAPDSGIFVAASIVPASPATTSSLTGPAADEGASSGAPGTPVQRPVIASAEPTAIEARVAAAQATASRGPSAPPDPSARSAVPVASRFMLPPQIEIKPAAPDGSAATPRASGLAAYAEPVALLRALHLAVTPSNVASAALAFDRPDRLPAALAALERALPRAATDANIATLKTLLAFVGRIDPRSPVLAAQIAAYIDHVVDGAEPKLATLLAASREAAPSSPDAGTSSRGAAGDPPPVATALALERGAALGSSLKQTLLNVVADPVTSAALAPALANALTALTAVQLNAAQALAANPDGIAFTIPLTTQYGSSNAHISVKRDGPGGYAVPLDGENFRIAFVLETAHYDTVAIDLVTVGRDVTVEVRTVSAPALRAFRDALATLSARLEALRYRVASAGAVLGTTSTVGVAAAPSPQPLDPDANVDRTA